MKDLNRLKGFSQKLDEVLDWYPHERIHSLGFTRRGDDHSVCFIARFSKGPANGHDDEANFEKLCGIDFGPDWYQQTTNDSENWISLVGVDLESIGTNKVRVYKNQPSSNPHDGGKTEWLEHVAYYIDSSTGEVTGTKEYWRGDNNMCYYINYYDQNGPVAMRQREVAATKEDWDGSEELLQIVEEENFRYVFTKKESKDQAYLIVSTR